MKRRLLRNSFVLAVLFLFWFLYRMAHPRADEPRWIYRLRRHPSAIPEYVALLAYGLFNPRLLRTGATREESVQPLPGDELITAPQWQETRAITVDVPAERLWPWIVQIGGDRGGFYWWTPGEELPEYARYVTQTYSVLPEFQTLQVGDRISDGGPNVSEERGHWVVKAVEPNDHLVLYAARRVSGGADFNPATLKPEGIWFVCSWAFVLRPVYPGRTRLLVRVRGVMGPDWLNAPLRLVVGKGDTVAHRSMLERIKARAEAYEWRAG